MENNPQKCIQRDSLSGESVNPLQKGLGLLKRILREEEITEDEYEEPIKQIKVEYQKGRRGGKTMLP